MLKAGKYLQRKAKRYRWIKQLNTKTKHFLVIFQKYFKRFRRYIEQDVYSNSCGLALKRELNKKVSILTIERSYQ
jgi:hypothetical protein